MDGWAWGWSDCVCPSCGGVGRSDCGQCYGSHAVCPACKSAGWVLDGLTLVKCGVCGNDRTAALAVVQRIVQRERGQ